MNLSLSANKLLGYTLRQIENFFPDGHHPDVRSCTGALHTTIDRLEYCFKAVRSARYCENGSTKFNHLYSDHYIVYLWLFANTLWKQGDDDRFLNKLYYLNKALHGFDCMYNTALPDRFLIIHGSGTVLGKAIYGDFFVAHHGCTVGIHDGRYPSIGKRVALGANSAVIGGSDIGDHVSVGNATTVFNSKVPEKCSVYRNRQGIITISSSSKYYADFYFDAEMNS